MSDNRRSQLVTEGPERAPNRAMLRAVGFSDADFDKPIVGVANAYSNLTPCNLGLDTLARRGQEALRAAGAIVLYLQETLKASLAHLRRLQLYRRRNALCPNTAPGCHGCFCPGNDWAHPCR